MYRRGPSKSTPANVQCQKCLKRDKLPVTAASIPVLTFLVRHYSYECKASAQERPYIPRPSRTQQLLNPKLAPKLASDDTSALQNTKGLADQELAKREAERARRRELERDDDTDYDASKRGRSASYDSVSTISTRGPHSPSHRRTSTSPPRPSGAIRSVSPTRDNSRGRSFDSGSDYERRYSPSPGGRAIRSSQPARQQTRSLSRDSSPQPRRFSTEGQPADLRHGDRRRGRYSSLSPSRSPPLENRRRFRSRSPRGPWRRDNSPPRYNDRSPGARRGYGSEQRRGAPKQEARERSLSPFSKRLALTQAMNSGQ